MKTLLCLLLLCGVAHADPSNEASMGPFTRAMRSDSANALTSDSLAGGGFGYARRLPLGLHGLEVWGTATMLIGTFDGEMFHTITTHVGTVGWALGGRARYPVWRFIAATAKLDAGVQRVHLELDDMADHTADDSGWGATTSAAIGLEMVPSWLSRFGLGFRAELGFVATSAIDMNAHSTGAPDDTNQLDRMAASLGSLDLGGRFFAFNIVGRF